MTAVPFDQLPKQVQARILAEDPDALNRARAHHPAGRHRRELPDEAASRYRCGTCNQAFTSWPKAERHVLDDHHGGRIAIDLEDGQ